MARLRCVGGSLDGQQHEINTMYKTDKPYRVGESVQLREPKPFGVLSYFPHPDEIPAMITETIHVYRIASFNFSKNDIHYFLIPTGWTDKQAILHQFRK